MCSGVYDAQKFTDFAETYSHCTHAIDRAEFSCE